jgi:TIR domain
MLVGHIADEELALGGCCLGNPITRYPQVFISHSSRRRADEELRKGDTPNRHRYRKKFLSMLLDRLESALEEAGFEVWVHRRRIGAGEEFESKLSFALYECDVGIILIDLDALDSAYVRKEATILMWRHQIDGIRVVPVLLGGVTEPALALTALGGTVGLSSLSLLTSPTSKTNRDAAQMLADMIKNELSSGIEPLDAESPSARWIQDFVHFISGVSVERLWRVAERLGVDRHDWVRAREPRAVVAGAMLGADLVPAHRALVQLVNLLDEDNAKAKTVHRALPLWVDLDAAKIVVDVGALPADRRVLAIATPAYRLGEHVIQRGTFSAPEYGTLRLPDVVGEDAHRELLRRYDAAMRRLLNFFDDDTSEDIAHELDSLGGGIFALMRCENFKPRTTVHLLEALRERFPGVVFVVLARRENTVWSEIDAPLAYRAASKDWERSARRYVSRTAGLIGEHIRVDSND